MCKEYNAYKLKFAKREYNIYMSQKLEHTTYWLPRVIAILFILFIGMFALDSFGTGNLWYTNILGFLVHLMPNFLLLGVLIFAWRNEKIGGIIFLLFYIAAIFFFRAEMIGLILFSPLILTGVLFLVHSRLAKRN